MQEMKKLMVLSDVLSVDTKGEMDGVEKRRREKVFYGFQVKETESECLKLVSKNRGWYEFLRLCFSF